jgi:hypothetical protein
MFAAPDSPHRTRKTLEFQIRERTRQSRNNDGRSEFRDVGSGFDRLDGIWSARRVWRAAGWLCMDEAPPSERGCEGRSAGSARLGTIGAGIRRLLRRSVPWWHAVNNPAWRPARQIQDSAQKFSTNLPAIHHEFIQELPVTPTFLEACPVDRVNIADSPEVVAAVDPAAASARAAAPSPARSAVGSAAAFPAGRRAEPALALVPEAPVVPQLLRRCCWTRCLWSPVGRRPWSAS